MKMNILHALALLHEADVRVDLLDNYNPANVTRKADSNTQKVRFEQTTQFYTIPAYEISSAGNLNISFTLKGKAHDIEHERFFDAVQFKCITIVKNRELFKQSLTVCPEDVKKVEDLGIEMNGNVLDLTKFDLRDGIEQTSDEAFAEVLVKQALYNAFRERKHKEPAPTLTADEEWLKQNGYYNGVWSPVILGGHQRVKNRYTDRFSIAIGERKCWPTITGIKDKLTEGKTLTELEDKVYNVYCNKTQEFVDLSMQINTIKYVRAMCCQLHSFISSINIAGEDFKVQVTV